MKISKRLLSIIVCITLIATVFYGCKGINENNTTTTTETVTEETTRGTEDIGNGEEEIPGNAEDVDSAADVEYDSGVEAKVDNEILDLVQDKKDDIKEGNDLSTDELADSKDVNEKEITDEGALEEGSLEVDGTVEIDNIAWEGANTGKGVSLLGKWQGLTFYAQYDSRWGSIPYTSTGNRSQTIKSSGCGPTSAAMVVSSSIGAITPPEMASIYKKNGFRTANNGTAWAAYAFTADYFNFSHYHSTYSYSDVFSYISTDKDKDGVADYFAVCSCGPGLFTSGGHYIALMGDSDGVIRVHDPYIYSGKFSTASRRGANVKVSGNIAYVTESKFKSYANMKCAWVFSNEHTGKKATQVTDKKEEKKAVENTKVNYVRYVATSVDSLNVRKGPGTSYGIVDCLTKGTKVTVTEVNGGWSKIGTNRWVSSSYLSATAPKKKTETKTVEMYVTASALNVRTGPGTNYKIVDTLKNKAKVTVYETKNGWSRIGKGRWVSSKYLSTKKSIPENNKPKSTVGQTKYFKNSNIIYSKSNLSGTQYSYKANTRVIIKKNTSSTVDYIYVPATGRYGYVRNTVYK